LLLLLPFVRFLEPGFIAMATLSTVLEESGGRVEIIDEDEVQLVPETQFADEYGDFDFDENDDNTRLESVTPGTKRILDAARPTSSHRSALTMADMSFLLQRPKSSGEDSLKGFSFTKHEMPNMNFSHGPRQPSPSPMVQKQDEAKEVHEGGLFHFLVVSPLTRVQQVRKQQVRHLSRFKHSKACSQHRRLITIISQLLSLLNRMLLFQAMPIVSHPRKSLGPRVTRRDPRSKPVCPKSSNHWFSSKISV
jgi:hypothetical protein